LSYQKLAQVEEQWPIVGRGDLYYGGTTYENSQGLGVHLPLGQGSSSAGTTASWPQVPDFKLPKLGLIAFPVTRLYDRGATLMHSELLHERIGEPYVVLNAADAARLKIRQGTLVRLVFADQGGEVIAPARLDDGLPERVALVPHSFGIPISGPRSVEVRLAERAKA
jgi:NADH-quinone oxidoreductase subunit G